MKNTVQVICQLLQTGIEHYQQHPALRKKTGISLKDLEKAGQYRRKLLKQIDKPTTNTHD